MPVYEYVCAKCGKTTESLRKMSEADAPTPCEHCGSRKTQRAHSAFAVGAASSGSMPLPMGGCGRCGDPNGQCPMR